MIENEDRLAFEMAVSTSASELELSRVRQLLDDEIRRGRFNRDRAQQVFLFAIDNSIHRYFDGLGVGHQSRILFPKHLREHFALQMCQAFVQGRDNVDSQRPTRTGFMALLRGK